MHNCHATNTYRGVHVQFLTFLPMYLKEVSDRLHITAALPAGKEPAALTALES